VRVRGAGLHSLGVWAHVVCRARDALVHRAEPRPVHDAPHGARCHRPIGKAVVSERAHDAGTLVHVWNKTRETRLARGGTWNVRVVSAITRRASRLRVRPSKRAHGTETARRGSGKGKCSWLTYYARSVVRSKKHVGSACTLTPRKVRGSWAERHCRAGSARLRPNRSPRVGWAGRALRGRGGAGAGARGARLARPRVCLELTWRATAAARRPVRADVAHVAVRAGCTERVGLVCAGKAGRAGLLPCRRRVLACLTLDAFEVGRALGGIKAPAHVVLDVDIVHAVIDSGLDQEVVGHLVHPFPPRAPVQRVPVAHKYQKGRLKNLNASGGVEAMSPVQQAGHSVGHVGLIPTRSPCPVEVRVARVAQAAVHDRPGQARAVLRALDALFGVQIVERVGRAPRARYRAAVAGRAGRTGVAKVDGRQTRKG